MRQTAHVGSICWNCTSSSHKVTRTPTIPSKNLPDVRESLERSGRKPHVAAHPLRTNRILVALELDDGRVPKQPRPKHHSDSFRGELALVRHDALTKSEPMIGSQRDEIMLARLVQIAQHELDEPTRREGSGNGYAATLDVALGIEHLIWPDGNLLGYYRKAKMAAPVSRDGPDTRKSSCPYCDITETSRTCGIFHSVICAGMNL